MVLILENTMGLSIPSIELFFIVIGDGVVWMTDIITQEFLKQMKDLFPLPLSYKGKVMTITIRFIEL